MHNYYSYEPPFILWRNENESCFSELNISSYEEIYRYDERCVKECVIQSNSPIPYLQVGSELLIFSISDLNHINHISDIDQVIKYISVKDIEIEASTDTFRNISYTAYITCKYLSIHEYYNNLINGYHKYLYDQSMYGDLFELDKIAKSRIHRLLNRKIITMTLTEIDDRSQPINYSNFNPQISKVIFANPNTIVLWTDGTKTIATCQKDTEFSKEIGLSIAIAKKTLGSWSNFQKYIDTAIISGTKEDHIAAKQRRKEKCLQKNN